MRIPFIHHFKIGALAGLVASMAFAVLVGCGGDQGTDKRLIVVSDNRASIVNTRLVFGHDAAQIPAGTAWMAAQLLESSASGLTSGGVTLIASAQREVLTVDITCSKAALTQTASSVAELLTHPTLDDSNLEQVQKNQFARLDALRHDPDWLARSVFWETIYQGTDYALPPIGTDSTISLIGAEDVAAFHQKFITADNFHLGLSGPVSASDAESFAAALRKSLPAGQPLLQTPASNTSAGLGVRIVELEEVSTATILVGFGAPHMSSDSASLVSALAMIMETSPSRSLSGMDQSLRFERGLVDAVHAQTSWLETTSPKAVPRRIEPTFRDYSSITIQTDPINALYAVRIVLKELADLNSAGLAEADIPRLQQILAKADSVDGDALSLMRTRVASRWMGQDEIRSHRESTPGGISSTRTRQLLRTAFNPAHLWIVAVVPNGSLFRTELLSGATAYSYPNWVDRSEIRRLDQEYLSFRPFWEVEKIRMYSADSLFR